MKNKARNLKKSQNRTLRRFIELLVWRTIITITLFGNKEASYTTEPICPMKGKE